MMIDNIDRIDELQVHFNKALFTKRLVSWYQANRRDLPWRVRWQENKDPYEVWVSEIMLQQTVIKAVIPAYERFLAAFPSVQDLANAEEDEVRLASRGLGYYRRFKLMHKGAKDLAQNPEQIWPETFKGWKEISGVGDYTAAAISSICFDQASPVVDGNVERVFCRLFDIRLEPNLPKLKRKFFSIGEELISKRSPGDFNQALMELGQTICTKQNPSCTLCPVQKSCRAFDNNSQNLAPKAKAKVQYSDVHMSLYVTQKGSLFGLTQRPKDSKFLKETWGFPTAIKEGKTWQWDGSVGSKWPLKSKAFATVKHSITSHKIKAEVFHVKADKNLTFRWLKKEDVEENLLSNLDRKAWKAYLKEHHS